MIQQARNITLVCPNSTGTREQQSATLFINMFDTITCFIVSDPLSWLFRSIMFYVCVSWYNRNSEKHLCKTPCDSVIRYSARHSRNTRSLNLVTSVAEKYTIHKKVLRKKNLAVKTSNISGEAKCKCALLPLLYAGDEGVWERAIM